ncbi:MAG: adenylate kinase [Vicinamibacterales bacterium]
MALNVVMLGPPGAGKGTQAERFAREHGIPRISTGDILREAVQSGSELGRVVKAVMERGELVSDELITGIVRERLGRPDVGGGFVLDGFPRTVPQAEALDGIVAGRDPLIVVEMQVPDEELVRRVQARRVCKVCGTNVSAFGSNPATVQRCEKCGGELVTRSDDTEAVVRERLRVYWRDTRPMIAYYSQRPTFRVIDGAQGPEQVREALVAAVMGVATAAGLSVPPGARA